MTAIVILALVAVFIGLRLYSVLGEHTGHEQPIIKPADAETEARIDPRTAPVTGVAAPTASDAGDLAYLPTAGPGVRALLAADPSFDVARFLSSWLCCFSLRRCSEVCNSDFSRETFMISSTTSLRPRCG